VSAGDPPVFLVHGLADAVVPVNQSRRLRAALIAAGVDHVYQEVPALGHIPPSAAIDDAARQWLQRQLASEPLFGDGFE
jgi:predicted esterase